MQLSSMRREPKGKADFISSTLTLIRKRLFLCREGAAGKRTAGGDRKRNRTAAEMMLTN